MANATLGATSNPSEGTLRSYLGLILSLPGGDSYIGSDTQTSDINRAYEKTAYVHDWPQMLIRLGIVITANVDRYPLPTGFRKFHHLKVEGIRFDETELDVLKRSRRKFAIDRNVSQFILSNFPSTASTAFTLSNSETAASAVTIELDTISGLSQYDEIWVDAATEADEEFTLVSSVDSDNTTITARLRAAKAASDILYRVREIIDIYFYRNVVLLSAASDTMLIPDELDFSVAHLAAYYAYSRLEDFTSAKEHLAIWENDVQKAFLASDAQSTGAVGQFVLG
ncbi:MAG TPA: hypothetical protein ENI23_16965 [bacterium]|nr:hypothetical protein [bacterium]